MDSSNINALISTGGALVGVIAGGLVGALINLRISKQNHDAEMFKLLKSSKMDLYKIVYPVKFEAAQQIAKQSAELRSRVRTFALTGSYHSLKNTNSAEAQRSLNDQISFISQFFLESYMSVWLLGKDFQLALEQFMQAAMDEVVKSTQHEYEHTKLDDAFTTLIDVLREELKLSDLDVLSPSVPNPVFQDQSKH